MSSNASMIKALQQVLLDQAEMRVSIAVMRRNLRRAGLSIRPNTVKRPNTLRSKPPQKQELTYRSARATV